MRNSNHNDVHPAVVAIMKNPDKMSGGIVTEAILAATFTPAELKLVNKMTYGYREVFGIEGQPMREDHDAAKLSHIMFAYPGDTLSMLIKPPVDDLMKRLEKRGVTKGGFEEIDGQGFLLIGWPIKEVIKLAKVWADLDAGGLTSLKMTDRGLVTGTIQRI